MSPPVESRDRDYQTQEDGQPPLARNGGSGDFAQENEKSDASNSNVAGSGEKDGDNASKPKKSILQRAQALWAKTGITWPLYKMMFKGALAPTIAISLFQSNSYSGIFTTVGYLTGIMSILSIVIQPRAKFLQTMLVNVLFICISAAIVMLALYCCVQARLHSGASGAPGTGGSGTSGTAAQGAQTAGYNSSASAIAGLWLIVLVYMWATVRAKKPQFMVPTIAGSIIANVGMVYAPQFSTMAQAEAFIQKLLSAMLTGFAIGTGVSLFIFPMTSRKVVFNDFAGFISGLRTALKANMDYVHSLEEGDMFSFHRTDTARHRPTRSPEAAEVKSKMQTLAGLHAKLNGDLPFAKREVALGNLGPDDLQQIAKLLRMVMVPMIGLSCLSDIFDRITEERGWDDVKIDGNEESLGNTASSDASKLRSTLEWHELTQQLREPFREMSDVIDQGLEHALLALRLAPKSSAAVADIEAQGAAPHPGQDGYAAYLDQKTRTFQEQKQTILRAWCSIRGISLPEGFFTNPKATGSFEDPDWLKLDRDSEIRKRSRRQLYICLYMEFLLWSIGRRVSDLVNFIESTKTSGKLDKRRLIVPGSKRLIKWGKSLLRQDPDTRDDQQIEGNDQMTTVYLGQAYAKKKDPMHLPPQNAWERFGNKFRKVSAFFASPESVFGFRVACATMCIAVVGYLHDTQTFYTEQRLFWAQIMVAIGMQPTAGQSLRTSWFRILGTGVFMLAALVAYYIVDGKTAGVLVFYFIFCHAGPWIIVKYPPYTTLGMIGPITMTLVIGYALQVRKISVQVAESNGQAYYPVYELGPIRLATVIGGLFLGWLWTIFPYPISEHSEQRKNLGSGLYLLANYYSVMHETVRARLRGLDEDPTIKGSVSQRLDKARLTIYGKCNLVLAGLRARTGFIKYDIPIGGKFPRQQYQDIVDTMQSILNFMALVSYASTAFKDMQGNDDSENQSEWLHTFRKLIGETNVTSQAITSLLSLMSASVSNSQALPPYLRVPEPYQYSKRLDEMDADLLSVRHIAEPGYASFAVIQLGTKCIIDDLKKLLAGVRELVGELDFSYHVISTADSSAHDSEETLTYTKESRQDGSEKKGE